MKIKTEIFSIDTAKEFEILNITKKIREIFEKNKIKEGFVNIFSKHTTLAIKINEDEKLLMEDFDWLMKQIAPDEKKYFHDIIELRKNCPPDEPKNAAGHLRCMVLETSQMIPVIDSKLQLGQYQEIFAIETSGPRERKIIVQIVGE
jgi:secondary thiamine-phosphate synthase enzyme